MKWIPPKNKKGRILSLLCVLLGGIGMMFSIVSGMNYAGLLQMVSIFLFLLGCEVLHRYEMTTFLYLLSEKEFVVIKTVGKKQHCVCNLEWETALDILKTPKKKKERKRLEAEYGPIDIRYNFAQVVRPDSYSLLFLFHGKLAEIVFEPDERMAEAIRRAIREHEDLENF